MLSKDVNERLTQVGPGTPMGRLMRYYWFPVAGATELDENPVRKVRLLGEDLVLYRDRSGNLGLIAEACPHRRVSMEYGIPEADGLRCPYHGWLFNQEGRCLEQPAEPWNSTFKDRVRTTAYRVEALGGLIFAYLGPDPAPLLPRYDLLVWDDAIRHVGITDLPCNYLQCVENGLDPTHAQWLHGHYLRYVWGRRGHTVPTSVVAGRHVKIGFDRFEHGIITRRVVESSTEEHEMWRIGGSVIFPVIRRVGTGMQWRVPVDDTHTRHYNYSVFCHGGAGPVQEGVPVYEIPLLNEDGKYNIDIVLCQDFMAWASQGSVTQRELEHLGQSDLGIILYRDLLLEQLERGERGEEPIGVYRDPAANVCISLPDVNSPRTAGDMFTQTQAAPASDFHLSPLRDTILALREEIRTRRANGEDILPLLPEPVYPMTGETHRELRLLPER